MYQGKKLGRRELVCHDSAHDANKHTKNVKKTNAKKNWYHIRILQRQVKFMIIMYKLTSSKLKHARSTLTHNYNSNTSAVTDIISHSENMIARPDGHKEDAPQSVAHIIDTYPQTYM